MAEHFIKQSYGKIWHFCHNSQGICYTVMSGNNLLKYEILESDAKADFDVLIDDLDQIHLICQNNYGDIIYFNYSDKGWEKNVILQSKTSSDYLKYFNILRVNNWINILYRIEYKGKKMLTHQILGYEKQTPDVVDIIQDKYISTKDSMGNIYVLYYSESKNSWGYKQYYWSKKEWSEFNEIDTPDNFKMPYIFIDSSDRMHIVGVSDGKIVYLNGASLVVGSGKNPIILEKENSLNIVWLGKDGRKVMMCVSSNYGKKFDAAVELMSGTYSIAKCFNLRYTSFETGFKAQNCYGYIYDDKITLYVLKEYFDILKNPPPPVEKHIEKEASQFIKNISSKWELQQKKDYENNELSKLKKQINQILNGIEEIQSEINSLNKRLDKK